MIRRRLLLALILGLAAPSAALAEDTIVEVKPCNLGCKLWRNVSGRSDAVAPDAAAPADAGEALPEATEGAGPPNPSRVVRQRGVVMEESPADRADRKRRRAALERELKANPELLVPTNGKATPAKP